MATTSTKKARVATDYQLLPVEDLGAGIDLRHSPSLMARNRARTLLNISLEEVGAILTYPGWRGFSTASLGAGRIQGGQRIYLSSGAFTLVGWNGAVYKPTDSGVWGSAVVPSLDLANQFYFPYDRDLVAVLDGAHVPKKSTDGLTWTPMGIAPPLAAPSLSAVAGGSLIVAHTYEVSYSYQDDELVHEGNESARSTQATAGANLTIRAAVVGSADSQVDKIHVYVRDVTAGESVRRRYTTVGNSNQNVDITADTWESAVEAPSDHDAPIAGLQYALVWKNRWWFIVGNRLYFSQIFQPQSVPALFYIEIPFERGDSITAASAQGDVLVVFGQSSKPFLIIGQTSLDFEVRPSAGGEAGALGFRAVEVIENGIVHVSAEGVYIFDGATDRLLSDEIDPGWQDIKANASATDQARIACIYHPTRKEIRIAVPRLYPFNAAGEWVLDLHRTRLQGTSAWTTTDRTIGGYILWRGNEAVLGNRGRLLSWSNTLGTLAEEAYGTSADGSNLRWLYVGPTLSTGLYMTQFCDGYIECEPNIGTFQIETVVDGRSMGSDTLDIAGTDDRYGSAVYGTAHYSAGNRTMIPFTLPLEAEGRTVLMKSTYTGQGRFKQYTYAYGMRPESMVSGI